MMNFNRPLILASNSPRRQELLRNAGFEFKVKTKEVDESYPEDTPPEEVAKYLAAKKGDAYGNDLKDEVVITADTIVKLNDQILGKPENYEDARRMLESLSSKEHEVITGVCIKSRDKQIVFDDTTQVYFKKLSEEEIDYYITNYRPYDKAGAYGIQEWIGMVGIEKIEGSFFTVVGLPVNKVYEALLTF
ncbi:Maf-like protein [Fulvivirga kasyanovii]|uniref:dTTP/UTP pyrophosphatase n=1 Tax=Fulvivirga kasyanovii TaxID=396812 RepID=A0ABW9RL72_9BACT|nr:Maf family nucleotide pyrophosphatase [Fulvivirga kasyanovii]MTI24842.1 septum formation protein Maf [Fulvivirga kasyanovii]